MHFLYKGVILFFALALASCNVIPLCPAATKEQAQQAEAALADFAVNLYKNITAQDQDANQVLSPVSVALALTLLEEGTDGQTRQQLKDALVGVGSTIDVLTTYRAIQKQLDIDDEKTKLSIANGLFQDVQSILKDDYVVRVGHCLETRVDKDNDFAKRLEPTRQKINKFVSDKTNGKIYELYKPGVLKSNVRMVLANAIYFKASWKTAFNKAMTKHQTFYKNGQDGDKQNVPFMRVQDQYAHTSTNDVEALEMPYDEQTLSFYVLLPKARDGLKDFEKGLTGKQLKSILGNLRQRTVSIELPKFVVRSKIDLTNLLTKMNLNLIFDKTADFSRMSQVPLKVDSAIHEGYINVNENGTEAAAATGVSIVATSVRIQDQPVSFVADHPFLYALVHKQTGAIVFLGRVTSVEAHNE